MLTLYTRTGCPFCATALDAVATLDLNVEKKNIEDESIAGELVSRGGKRQVPYLVDTNRNIEMYESEDIIHYLKKQYGSGVRDTEEKDNPSQVCTLEC